MALTQSNLQHSALATKRVGFKDLAFDSSYPTGGEALTPGDFGLQKIEHVHIEPKSGYVFEYDYDNNKVKAMYADYDAVADGALIEVANEADLSALTVVKVMAIGY